MTKAQLKSCCFPWRCGGGIFFKRYQCSDVVLQIARPETEELTFNYSSVPSSLSAYGVTQVCVPNIILCNEDNDIDWCGGRLWGGICSCLCISP